MKLKGSCHCGAVDFECESKHPYPYQLCYCNICRKTAGGGGYVINLAGDSSTLSVRGEDFLSTYCAKIKDPETSSEQVSKGERKFCKRCGSFLWSYNPTWPELVHPFASAIDSELPVAPERTHLMLESKPSWVQPNIGPKDLKFDRYPEESIAQWHQRLHVEG